jgi:hypothetical protein
MAYNITSQRGEVEAYVMELVCDTEADVSTLPTSNCAAGSTCLVIESSNVYVLNSEKVWKKI